MIKIIKEPVPVDFYNHPHVDLRCSLGHSGGCNIKHYQTIRTYNSTTERYRLEYCNGTIEL